MKMRPISITIDASPSSEDVALLERGLDEHNAAVAPEARDYRPLVVLAHDEHGVVVGGLSGATYWHWLHIKHLWVHPQFRRQHLGRRLIAEAEAEAVHRGCFAAYLDTFSFQALHFYQACGYATFGRLDGFPPGESRFFLSRQLNHEGTKKTLGTA